MQKQGALHALLQDKAAAKRTAAILNAEESAVEVESQVVGLEGTIGASMECFCCQERWLAEIRQGG